MIMRTALGLALLPALCSAFSAPRLLGAAKALHNPLAMASSASAARRGQVSMLATAAPPAAASVKRLTSPQEDLLKDIDVFIFDCDGVIWRGDSLIDQVPSVLEKLRAMGKRMFFVTNNSTKSRKGYKGKFSSLGLDVQDEEIFSSSFAAAAYLEQKNFKATGKKVYIIGEVGIADELDLIGVPHIGGPADKGKTIDLTPGFKLEIDHDVGAVVVGFDRHFNYHKIQYAQLAINENGAEFIATNMDAVTHLTDAQEWAGAGSMVGCIKGCTGQEPTLVGKPSPLMIDYIVYKYKIPKVRRFTLSLHSIHPPTHPPTNMDSLFGKDNGLKTFYPTHPPTHPPSLPTQDKICMVGDQLDTDILFGKDNGLKTVLTLSGVTSEAKLLGPENKIHPDYYVSSIADFFP